MNQPSTGIDGLQGTWSLVDWVQTYDDGRTVRPFGENPTGFITYSGERMCCVISRSGRERFRTGGQWTADAVEKASAYDDTLAYAGRFSLHGYTVTHHVEVSLFPNWVGANQERAVSFDGTTLHLEARLEQGTSEARTARLSWVRTDKH